MSADAAPRHWAVVPAAGLGQRMAVQLPKQYHLVAGQPLLQQTLQTMLSWGFLEKIAVALHAHDRYWAALPLARDERLLTVTGGAQRATSVQAGLTLLAEYADADDWVWVHDAVRPCVSKANVEALRASVRDDPVGGLLAVPLAETLKRADSAGRVETTLARAGLWCAQTPQVFRFGLLRTALAAVLGAGVSITDESAAMEWAGHRARLVPGDSSNLKITRSGDSALAAAWLQRHRGD